MMFIMNSTGKLVRTSDLRIDSNRTVTDTPKHAKCVEREKALAANEERIRRELCIKQR